MGLWLVMVALVGLWSAATAQSRPNVVLIITDDMGYGDLSSYGAPDVRTPNIDRIGREGVRLTDFYANGQFCTPTRAGLITGRYQQRYRLEEPLGGPTSRHAEVGLPASEASLPALVKRRGYATALIGKWHLGYQPAFSPGAHGFDYFFGFKSGYVDYYQHTGGDGRPDLFENERAVRVEGYLTDVITERSVRFIRERGRQPFFLEVSYGTPHWPYQPPGRPSVARRNAAHLMPYDSATGTRADYVAMVENADQGVGRILTTLDSMGLASNTLVIFTNDNGGEWLSRNAPLFGRKWTLWEGGIRVPALLRWPGRIPAGRVSGQVGMTMDLTATILAAVGAAVADPAPDGIDLLPMLSGDVPEIERTLFWRTAAGGLTQRAVRSGDWKLLIDGPNTYLFDVRRDLGERADLASTRSDVAARLRPLLTGWETAVDAEAKARAGQ
ncbi:MAG: twin-arginine translocation pathway signal protein [Gemmatimonadetes bacterium]|nr:twin-arginine translocation pathway signal protein [Gemmatimonadota bacterium]